MAGLWLFLSVVASQAVETEHRLGEGVSLATGIGFEITHGDYGVDADATMITLPLLIAVNPGENIDLTLEVPLVYLSSRSGSDVVITHSGRGGVTAPQSSSNGGGTATQSGGNGNGGGTVTQSEGNGLRQGPGGETAMSPATTTPASTIETATSATTSSKTVTDSGLGDISLSAGWTLLQDSDRTPKIRPTIYLKVPTGDDDRGLGTGTFECGPGLYVSKWFGDWQLFAEGAYIFQDSTGSYPGENYISYTAGGGVQATDRLFVSLYVDGSSALVADGSNPLEGWLKLNFLQSRRLSWEAYVLAGFTDANPDTGGGLLMMYQF